MRSLPAGLAGLVGAILLGVLLYAVVVRPPAAPSLTPEAGITIPMPGPRPPQATPTPTRTIVVPGVVEAETGSSVDD